MKKTTLILLIVFCAFFFSCNTPKEEPVKFNDGEHINATDNKNNVDDTNLNEDGKSDDLITDDSDVTYTVNYYVERHLYKKMSVNGGSIIQLFDIDIYYLENEYWADEENNKIEEGTIIHKDYNLYRRGNRVYDSIDKNPFSINIGPNSMYFILHPVVVNDVITFDIKFNNIPEWADFNYKISIYGHSETVEYINESTVEFKTPGTYNYIVELLDANMEKLGYETYDSLIVNDLNHFVFAGNIQGEEAYYYDGSIDDPNPDENKIYIREQVVLSEEHYKNGSLYLKDGDQIFAKLIALLDGHIFNVNDKYANIESISFIKSAYEKPTAQYEIDDNGVVHAEEGVEIYNFKIIVQVLIKAKILKDNEILDWVFVQNIELR